MISLTSAIRRRPGMSRGEFFRYLTDVHGAIAAAEPGDIRRYQQNHVTDAVAGIDGQPGYTVSPDRDNVTEVHFDDLPALFADLARPYTREKIGPDGVNFSDLASATALVGEVFDLEVPRPGSGGAKVIAFLSAREGLSLEEFVTRWRAARTAVPTSGLEAVRKAQLQERLPEGDELVSYFGGRGAPSYQGTVSLWFDDESTAFAEARDYLAALDAHSDFVDLSRSWSALVTERVIYSR